jgi:hypothetical protein
MGAQRIAAVLLASGLCVAVLLAASWNLGLSPVDKRLVASPADEPARVFRQLSSELTDDGAGVSDFYRNRVRNAVRRDPLSDEVFILEAMASRNEGRFREGLERLEQARNRDPRNRLTRLMLFESYLREARAKEVVVEAAVLDRLGAGSTQMILPLVASLAQNPSTRNATAEALGSSVLEYPVLRALAERQVSAALIIALSGDPSDVQNFSDDTRRRISGLTAPYIRAGQWSQVADLWTHFYARQSGELGRVTDTEFTGKLGPPFGWQFSRSDGGVAQSGDNGLEVVDFGRKGWEVARQALMLRPGTYRLQYKLSEKAGNLPDLAWRLECDSSGGNLLDLPFQSHNFLGQIATDRFTVPAVNCPAQWLSLISKGGGGAETRSVIIGSVEISQPGEE